MEAETISRVFNARLGTVGNFSIGLEVLIRCLISNFMNEDRGPFNVTLVSSNVNLQAKQLESITNFFSHDVKKESFNFISEKFLWRNLLLLAGLLIVILLRENSFTDSFQRLCWNFQQYFLQFILWRVCLY